MVASTDIKWYTSTNTNAPQLTNTFGNMLDLLDACLVNGFGSQTISTMGASGTTVTVTFGTAHNFLQYQVIEIAGATPAAYNGQFRILTVPNSTSFTFELASTPSASTATGTMTCKLPPLGWLKPFSGTGKAAYRSADTLLPSRPYLRVVDVLDPAYTSTYAKYAKVGLVETMTDIDTMSGVQAPYDGAAPTKNWVGTGSGTTAVNGWARWYYARDQNMTVGSDTTAPTTGSRAWVLVGTTDAFYLLPSVLVSPNNEAVIYGFGAFESTLNIDNANNFLSATVANIAANSTASRSASTPLGDTIIQTLYIQRKYDQTAVTNTAKTTSLMGGQVNLASGTANTVAAPATQGNIPFAPVLIYETGNVLRGKVPLLNWLFQDKPYSDMQVFVENNKVYLARRCYPTQSASIGQVVLKIGDL